LNYLKIDIVKKKEVMANVLPHDSYRTDAAPERESSTHEIEGCGLGPKRYSSTPIVTVPEPYRPRRRIMADPIDSAL
jgi:hypothetical protein